MEHAPKLVLTGGAHLPQPQLLGMAFVTFQRGTRVLQLPTLLEEKVDAGITHLKRGNVCILTLHACALHVHCYQTAPEIRSDQLYTLCYAIVFI